MAEDDVSQALDQDLVARVQRGDSAAFDLLVKEVAREMTQKSGQKCTAIRRVLVPEALYGAAAEAIGAQLARVTVGNPRNESVRMGALVSRAQFDAVQAGIAQLQRVAETLHDGRGAALVDADPAVAAAATTSAQDRCEWTTAGASERTACRTAATASRTPCSGPTGAVVTAAPRVRSRSASDWPPHLMPTASGHG